MTDINTSHVCGNCKYRGPNIHKEGFGQYHADGVPQEYFGCELIKQAKAYPDEEEKIVVGLPCVIDASDYFAAICVPEDFGCNKWEPK